MNEPIVRMSRPNDVNVLTALDLKSYYYAFDLEQWRMYITKGGQPDHPKCVVVDVFSKSAGFALWQELPPEHGSDETVLLLVKLGVLPDYRRKGLGSLLMDKAYSTAQRLMCDKIKTIVPETSCCPNKDGDVSAFLNGHKFKTTGEVVPEYAVVYGQTVDGYVFERAVL